MSLQPGAVVDRYEIIEQHTTDLLSSTYLARQIESGELATLCTFFEGREVSDAFQLEFPAIAEKLTHLDHPNLEQVVGYGKLDQGVYLVYETGAGEPFEAAYALPLQTKEATEILRQVARALEYLHSEKITHGDLSLQSILVDFRGQHQAAGIWAVQTVEQRSGLVNARIDAPAWDWRPFQQGP